MHAIRCLPACTATHCAWLRDQQGVLEVCGQVLEVRRRGRGSQRLVVPQQRLLSLVLLQPPGHAQKVSMQPTGTGTGTEGRHRGQEACQTLQRRRYVIGVIQPACLPACCNPLGQALILEHPCMRMRTWK